jgi:hypothetical protein
MSRMRMHRLLALLTLLLGFYAFASEGPRTLVVCAPGYPGDTDQAQPTMDSLARAVARGAGWSEESVTAVYHEEAEPGLARLKEPDATLALVPLPFFLQHAEELSLNPLLQAVQKSGASESWSLVARKGAVSSPESLADWEVTGMPGYAPEFVRGLILGEWGELPATASITFTSRALGALRKAAAGEKLAVILDQAQTKAISSLPFAGDLEVVTRSEELPGALLCSVAGRLDGESAEALQQDLLQLHKSDEGAELLETLRMSRFRKIDRAALEAARKATSRS